MDNVGKSMIHHATFAQTESRIAGIVRSAEAVTIGLLDDIDDTLSTMVGIATIMDGLNKVIAGCIEQMSVLDVVKNVYMDANDELIDRIVITSSTLKDFLARLVAQRSSIDRDSRLKEHHCESLHDAYEEAINATTALIESMDNFRLAIISYDLKAEPREDIEVFETVDDLISNLRGK